VTDFDRIKFSEVMTRLARHYGKVFKADADRDGLARTLFHGLKGWTIEDVIHGAEHVIETSRRFPIVAEWNAAIVAVRRQVIPCPTDARQMTPAEILEHERAYALHYEDEPCCCGECVRANVDHLAIRFVPLDDEVAFNPKVGRLVPIGYWLHGEGLGRWYEARQKFFASAENAGLKPERVLVLVGASRDPGEDG